MSFMNKMIQLKFGDKTFDAYHAYPDHGGKHPGLILIEEIWGVNGHIKNMADRFAKEGFSVLAPELLPEGILEMLTPQIQKDLFDPEKRNEVQPKLRAAMAPIMVPEFAEEAVGKLKECVSYLLADHGVNGSVSVLGFCFGGTYSYALAASDSRVKCAVPFYGHAPQPYEKMQGISCPVLAFYGEKDQMLIAQLPEVKQKMKEYGKNFETVVYPNAGHAFMNDTNERAYNADAAKDAWSKSLAFLKTHGK